MQNTRIKIEATISATSEKVWSCWTLPEHITQWNFASPDWQCPWAKNDLRVGGRYTARMEARDGSFGFEFTAIYDEVVDQRKMVYTMEDGRRVITEFQSMGEQTKVITTFDAESQNSVEMQRNGWQAILENFKRYVESR